MSKFAKIINSGLHIHERVPRWVDIVLVSVLILGVCYLNLDWAQVNQKPPISDAANHAQQSVQFHNIFTSIRLDRALVTYLTYQSHYPPLCYQVGEIGYLLCGTSLYAPVVGIFPFTALMAFSMYFLGCRMGGRLGGLAAAVMSCTSPICLEYCRVPFLDFQLSASVAFGMCALLYSEGFSNTKMSLFCGVAIALGMLTKWTFPLFIFFPLVVAIISALCHTAKSTYRSSAKLMLILGALIFVQYLIFSFEVTTMPENGPGWWILLLWIVSLVGLYYISKMWLKDIIFTPVNNMLLAIGVMLIMISPWYCHNIMRIWHKIVYQANVIVPYKKVLLTNLISINTWIYCAMIFLGLGTLVGIIKKKTRWFTVQVLATAALTLAILSYAPYDPRYVMPLIVHLICIGVCVFSVIGSIGILPLLALIVIGSTQASFHKLTTPPRWYTMPEIIDAHPFIPCPLPCYPVLPNTYDYPYKELVGDFVKTYTSDDTIDWYYVFIGTSKSESSVLQPRSLPYYGLVYGRYLDVMSPLTEDHAHSLGYTRLRDSNFILIYKDPESNFNNPERRYELNDPTTREEIVANMQALLPFFPRKFTTKKLYRFGPDTMVELLERKD